MKRAGRLVTDKDLAEHMKENGLGTPATRAETIEKLVRSEYLERKKKHLLPTSKGVALVDQVDTQLRDPVLTAQWEERLADIEDGKANARDLEADVASWVAELVPSILRSKPMSEETKQEGLGPCPKCQAGFVRKTPKGWGCSRYKEAGCDFVIWAQVAGKKLTEAVARELVQSGTTAHAIEGFVSKEKKTFAARLKLDSNHRVVFVFEERPPAQDLGPCPACKEGRVRATPKGWGCSRYKQGCTLSIWREYHGKVLSEHVARELVEHGTTSKPVEGLVAKDGKKKFSAQLRFDERWRVVPVFEAKSAQADQPTA
jgi:DNA topoisomerase-3